MPEWLTVLRVGQLADAMGVTPSELVDALDRTSHEFRGGEAEQLC